MNRKKTKAVATTTPINTTSVRKGRPRKNYWALELVMEYIKDEKFQTLQQYKDYVVEQKFEDMFPLCPNIYYKDKYPGVDIFLGNPVGTSKQRVKYVLARPENRALAIKGIRESAIERRAEKAKKAQEALEKKAQEELANAQKVALLNSVESSINLSSKPDIAQCFKTLLEHNVSYETLSKVNTEMKYISIKEAREITTVLLDFLGKKAKVTA